MATLNAAGMISEAERQTGLTDWGGDEFREPFNGLVRAINEEALLNTIGYARARQRLLQRLCQRLKLLEDRKQRPEIAAQKIERPVMVVGLPRAGTTYTHSLLGADPANVAPLGWQLTVPSPPPNDPAIDHAPAIREAQTLDADQGWNAPHIKALHDFNPLHPEECARAFEMSFHSLSLVGYWSVPSYFGVLAGDSTHVYDIHKKTLQALQVGVEGRRWVLKAPEHTTQLDALLKVYPDAMLVQNHRDPSRVMASLISIIRGLHQLSTDHVPEISREFVLSLMQSLADGQANLIRLRQDPEINRHFVDVPYLDLERDPLGVMRNIYARTGMTYSDASEKAISGWIETNRKGKHGKHRYSLADVKMSQDEVHEMFKGYIEHFDIELEPMV